jgi:hypothetical protein
VSAKRKAENILLDREAKLSRGFARRIDIKYFLCSPMLISVRLQFAWSLRIEHWYKLFSAALPAFSAFFAVKFGRGGQEFVRIDVIFSLELYAYFGQVAICMEPTHTALG